jgi:hypothetical protein
MPRRCHRPARRDKFILLSKRIHITHRHLPAPGPAAGRCACALSWSGEASRAAAAASWIEPEYAARGRLLCSARCRAADFAFGFDGVIEMYGAGRTFIHAFCGELNRAGLLAAATVASSSRV